MCVCVCVCVFFSLPCVGRLNDVVNESATSSRERVGELVHVLFLALRQLLQQRNIRPQSERVRERERDGAGDRESIPKENGNREA